MKIQKIIFCVLICVSCFVIASEENGYQLLDDGNHSGSEADDERSSSDDEMPIVVVAVREDRMDDPGVQRAYNFLLSRLAGIAYGVLLGYSVPFIHYDPDHSRDERNMYDKSVLWGMPLTVFTAQTMTSLYLHLMSLPLGSPSIKLALGALGMATLPSPLPAFASEEVAHQITGCPLVNLNSSESLGNACHTFNGIVFFANLASIIILVGTTTIIIYRLGVLPVHERRHFWCKIVRDIGFAFGAAALGSTLMQERDVFYGT